jgi:hypothetical protein
LKQTTIGQREHVEHGKTPNKESNALLHAEGIIRKG